MSFKIKMKALEVVVNLFRQRVRVSPDKINFSQVKTVVVLNNKRLGDFLFCTPAIKALKDANPQVRVITVTSHSNKNLIMDCPYIDEVRYMGESMKEAIEIGKELRKEKPELGIIFHSKCPYDIVAMTLSGVACLMKHYFGNERKVLIKACDAAVMGGVYPPVQNDLSLVKMLGINTEGKKMFYPSDVGDKTNTSMSVGIQLGASASDRYFPAHIAAQVVEEISNHYPQCVFHLIGSENETGLSNDFYDVLKPELAGRVVCHIGKTTLHELAILINNFTVLITPDTGCLHIATALQTKTVSLFTEKQQKASIPQQDTELHQVLYASDFVLDRNANNISKLTPIPTSEIVAATIRALN
ncbi:glycosyltransferase family 9 protein [Enterobacter hormaechei]|uniref:glycosyltransferase family 9 protein n=1 Tax=Enterobacter cloacae complex TaxID=354276 RepID=UPI000651014A|nr:MULTISPECIES: glycosyltransferase family 9 protein [Enterobacter cloacae complex]EHF4961244.1 glycosyltransferase family 9 protein [Enterobacter hormaechei]EHF4968502.1 glycosyltransferase family 9 protein [Enterobacter hormaechei]EHF4975726.1 glycosyltransferase family 9 protein [Enterobacter hormaechei]EHF4987919.1 glycosyltransferase family 9 protein [Enterobacter hormaechei]EHF5052203.1 glycosyltransferase family 9 protein [Enterobacter hormaechei]